LTKIIGNIPAEKYVNENGIKIWFCDLSESRQALKPEDPICVETEFKKAITAVPLTFNISTKTIIFQWCNNIGWF